MSRVETAAHASEEVQVRHAARGSLRGWVATRVRFGRRRNAEDTARLPLLVVCVAGLFLATGALVSLGYVATREWNAGTNLLLERRANEALALVRAALSADMKGACTLALVPINMQEFDEDPPYSLLQVTAGAFARFPYPESFVLWRHTASGDGVTYAFNRADRLPPWTSAPLSDDPFPVVLLREPPALAALVATIRQQASPRAPFLVLSLPVGGTPYQVVVRSLFASTRQHELVGFLAFTVNLSWVESEYFRPLIQQVDKIGGNSGGLATMIADHRGRIVASTGPAAADAAALTARFPFVFIDRALIRKPVPDLHVDDWTVRVRPVPDNPLFATLEGARRILLLMTVAAGASLLALVLTVKADRASVALASMKSDFVAAVTHELKTPVALIRLVGDTLASGRYSSAKTVQEYAGLLSQEASRLSTSIDNLLTYARYSNRSSIDLADIEPAELIEDALQRFRPTLEHLGFDVRVDVPIVLPCVAVDRRAMTLAVDNIIDNAIKYSGQDPVLAVSGRVNGRSVTLTFRDRGSGIPREDLAHVFERFYRGRNAGVNGSGLGLAIAQRIVHRHGGDVVIRSTVGVGTKVDIVLPAARRRNAPSRAPVHA